MIEIDDFEFYQKFLLILKEKQGNPLEKLSALHASYQKILFKNSQSKKLYNKNLNFLHILCKTRSLSVFHEIQQQNPEIIQELVNKPNEIGWTPLYFSIKKKDFAFVQALLASSAEITVAKYASPLILACQYGNPEIFSAILEKTPLIYREYQDSDGISALFMAVYAQKLDFIKEFIEKHAFKTTITDKRGASLLHWAADTENLAIIRYFLEIEELRQLINLQDHEGNTMLHHLAENCDKIEVFQEVFSHGANEEIKNNEGLAPVEWAKKMENLLGEEILATRKIPKEQENYNSNSWCLII